MFVGSMLYGSWPVLPEGAAKTSSMSCAATCHGLLFIDASWPQWPRNSWGATIETFYIYLF